MEKNRKIRKVFKSKPTIEGAGVHLKRAFGYSETPALDPFLLLDDGEQVVVSTEDEPVRFLLISGKPIGEPVSWYGPIVMNSQEELQIAFEEYNNGTFIRHKNA
jgi:hypothetical protein